MKYYVVIKKVDFNQDSKYVFVDDWNLENLVEKHPNHIHVGYQREGIAQELPEVDKCLYLSEMNNFRMFRTSPVVEILSETMFKTLNSVYSIEVLKTYADDEDPMDDFRVKDADNKSHI